MIERRVEFQSEGITLRGQWHEPRDSQSFPVVLFATGDGPSGSKGQTWTNLIPMFAAHHVGVLLFDFAGLGYSDGERRQLTLSRGLANLTAAVAELRSNPRVNLERVGAFGSSFGGNALLLGAAQLPTIKVIGLKSPACYLPEAFLCEFGHEVVERWSKDGYLDEVGFDYEAFLDPLTVSTYAAARAISYPVRVVHGGADSIVPTRQSRDLIHYLQSGSLRVIDGADHWYAEGNQWETMAKDLVGFLVRELTS